jgi:hypothetical protein
VTEPIRPTTVTLVDVDVLAALVSMQSEIEQLTRAVQAQQATLDLLVAQLER